jgi:predicted permease
MLLGLGKIETVAITFVAGLPVGVNVYLMTRIFNCAQGLVANAMLVSTLLSSLSVPLLLTLIETVTGAP